MWWPRPRWKSDIFTRFVLLLLFIITTTNTKNGVMADEGQQHCGSGNMSAVVWTTVFCTMLLVLAIVAIYFIYCKRREHGWSSLWWKSNSDKNLVLQTSAPVKNQQQMKNGGTDNPAFSSDAYVGDCATKTGLTRVVRITSSSISEGSLLNELSLNEEDGRQIYMCKHNDGSKDRLVALRLVFDKGQQQLSRPTASDLSSSLIELSRKYGLHVELETEGEAVVGTSGKCNDTTSAKCGKSNILSAVRGKAQRLWNHRQFVFKGGDSSGRVNADKEIVDGDLESGRAEAVHAGTAPPVQKSSSSVMTVNETGAAQRPARNNGGSLRYRTLEYGASPVDAETQSSPDSGVQCCTVNPSVPVPGKVDKDAAASVTVTIDSDVVVAEAAVDKDTVVVASVNDVVVMVEKHEAVRQDKDEAVKADKNEAVKTDKNESVVESNKSAAAVLKTVDDEKKSVVMAKLKNDEPKHANPPPPPPPRKYNTVVVPPTVPVTAVTVSLATAAAVTCNASVADNATVPTESCTASVPVACTEPVKPPAAAINEIRVDDDYYWCTTTTMAPSMSTFGKRPSAMSSVESGSGGGAADTTIGDGAAAVQGVYDKGATMAPLTADDNRDVVAGATTSIEDASLPSFSSDEEEDDDENCSNSVVLAVDKSKFPLCSSISTLADVVGGVSGDGTDVIKIDCNGESLNNKNKNNNNNNNNCDVDVDGSRVAPPNSAEPKSPTKLPSLRLSLSSPLSSTVNTSCCSSSASSTSSTSPSPTNSSTNNSPIVSKIPVRRQSAGSGVVSVSTPLANGTAKKAIPLPLSRSGSRLAMWTSAN